MVELGFLDLDTLTIFLGVELSTPVATRAALEKAKKRAVQILKPEIAAHYRCIPLLIQERQVIAAIEDPHDMESLDELLRITGYRVVPRVAPEVRIHLYLERYYGIERPPRFTSIVDSPIAARDSAARLPGRPLPGLPKYSESPIKAPNQAPPLRTTAEMPAIPAADDAGTSASSSLDRDDDSFDEIELEAADLLFELDNDEENADQAPVSDSFADDQASTVVAPAPCAEEYHPVSVADTLEAMEEATGRNEIAKALMAYASGAFDVAALCIVRDNMAFGWKAHGNDLNRTRIETLLVPLDRPSMFASAIISEDQTFCGAPTTTTLHKYLYRVLCCPKPKFALVRAICIGNRIVNIFYGHRNADSSMASEDLEGIQEVCTAARRAYVRMITRA